MSALHDYLAPTRAQARRLATIDRLARGITLSSLAGVMASPPTVAASSTTTAIATASNYGPFESADNSNLYTFLRAITWNVAGGTEPLRKFWRPYAATGSTPGTGGANGDKTGSCPLVRFYCDAAEMEIINRGTFTGYRVYVDGELVDTSALAQAGPGSGVLYTHFDFGSQAMRLFEVEGNNGGDFYFGGVRIGPTAKVWPAPLLDTDLKVIVHGDSFAERSMARFIAQLIGQRDTRGSALGGTGYIADNGGTRNTFIERVTYDIINPAPDVIIETGGWNDESLISGSAANMQAVVEPWLDAVQAALPDALIFMTGPMSPGTSGSNVQAVRDGKEAACAGRSNVYFIDNLDPEWVTGTGKSGAAASDGNADWVTDTDGTHPTDLLGGQYLASRVVAAIAALLPAMRSAIL